MEEKTTIMNALDMLLKDPSNQFSDIVWQQIVVASPAAFYKYNRRKYIESENKLSHRMIDFTKLKIY